jgi:hemerythrin superfamily protein
MDPTLLLEADHRQVEDLLDDIAEADGSQQAELVGLLATALRAHMDVEEQVVYPAMAPVTGQETVEEGVNEHNLVRKALEDVVELAGGGPGFKAALEVIKTGIEHHVSDEEGEVFPQLRQEGQEQLAAMEARFLAKRTELGLPSDPGTLAEHTAKRDLMEQAKAAGVRGRASMTKEQLAAAITNQA